MDIVYTYIYNREMFLYQVITEFKKNKVQYAVVGGFALALHGLVRATMDIDFVIKLDLKNFELAEQSLKNLGLTSRLPVRAQDVFKMRKEYIENRNLIAWSFANPTNPFEQIDIIITTDLSEIEIEPIAFSGLKIPVISLESLIEMKRQAGRPQDLLDIENIKRSLHEEEKNKK